MRHLKIALCIFIVFALIGCKPSNRSMTDDAVIAVKALIEEVGTDEELIITSLEWVVAKDLYQLESPSFSIYYELETDGDITQHHVFVSINNGPYNVIVFSEEDQPYELFQGLFASHKNSSDKPYGAFTDRQIAKILSKAKE
jgi:hypothetical protein